MRIGQFNEVNEHWEKILNFSLCFFENNMFYFKYLISIFVINYISWLPTIPLPIFHHLHLSTMRIFDSLWWEGSLMIWFFKEMRNILSCNRWWWATACPSIWCTERLWGKALYWDQQKMPLTGYCGIFLFVSASWYLLFIFNHHPFPCWFPMYCSFFLCPIAPFCATLERLMIDCRKNLCSQNPFLNFSNLFSFSNSYLIKNNNLKTKKDAENIILSLIFCHSKIYKLHSQPKSPKTMTIYERQG